MYKHRTVFTCSAILLFILTLIVVSSHGKGNRIVAPGNTVLTVDSPDKAFDIWQEKKVRGRSLLLFDTYPHAGGLGSYSGPPQLTPSNLVEFSIFRNIVRKIYFMVPETEWNTLQQQKWIIPIREVPHLEKGLFLYNLNGIPLIATTPSSLPPLTEKVLVYVNSRIFTPDQVRDLLAQKGISSDIFITYQGHGR